MPNLYRNFATQAQIDEQYDVERSVPDFMVYARHFIGESQAVRDTAIYGLEESNSLLCEWIANVVGRVAAS